jgi:Leucine-rich repeat (LRR) protein
MKKKILSILTLLALGSEVNAQTVNIPDANFKTYLLGNASINTDADPNEISAVEATAFAGTINCSSLSISDLTGIEAFTNLTVLYCSSNSLGSLDVTQNTALTTLHCQVNPLGSIDVTQNIALTSLNCGFNTLTDLNVTQNTNLIYLYCSGNSLTSLNVTLNTALQLLKTQINSLTSLDVSQNIALTYLWVQENALTSLDVSPITGLLNLSCRNNLLPSLDISQNSSLTEIWCNDNLFTTLNVANGNNANFLNFFAANNPNITCIEVDDVAYSATNWTDIDAGASFSTNCNAAPCTVTIPDANFKAYLVGNTAINTNGNTEIECSEASTFSGSMNCDALSISDLAGIETFTSLTQLDCSNNSLTTLDLSQNTTLNFLQSNNNSLTILDLSQNPVITGVFCYNNSLTTLDLNQNMPLTILNCQTNQLTSLDISGFTSLTGLYCGSNQLTDLNVANGNNINMDASLDPGLIAVNNPNLTCIQIDAGYIPNGTDWVVDATASFSTNCSSSVGINELTTQEVIVYPNPVQNQLFVALESGQITKMDILDLSGKVVKSIDGNSANVNVSDLNNGIYILKVYTQNGVSNTRFVKQ